MQIPFFGDINIDSLQTYYKVTTDFEGKKLQLDINFENTSIAERKLSQVKTILENLKESVEKAKGFINKEFKTESAVDDYIDFSWKNYLKKILKFS